MGVIGWFTVIVLLSVAGFPLLLVHVIVYVEVEPGATVSDPLVALLPDHAPDAEHDVAFEDVQLKSAVSPLVIVFLFEDKFTVGFTG